MTASIEFLTVLVSVAIGAAAVAPVVLITLWIRDRKSGRLW